MRGERVARGELLGVDRPSFIERSRGKRRGASGRRRRAGDPVDCPREVGRRRPRRLQRCARSLQARRRRIRHQPQRDPVPGGDSDQRGASDCEPSDRVGDVVGGAQRQPALGPWQRGLIERHEDVVLEPQRNDGPGKRCNCHREKVTTSDSRAGAGTSVSGRRTSCRSGLSQAHCGACRPLALWRDSS